MNQEIATGRKVAEEFERQVVLETDPAVIDYINELGKKIVTNSDALAFPVSFKVVRSTEVNAQVFIGGFVYVNTATIAAMDNEAELAFALAHHIARVAARHASENASKFEMINFASIPIVFAGGVGGFTLRAQAGLLIPMQFLQMQRKQVTEADFLGVQYLYQAGYDPTAGVTFLQKMQALESSAATGTPKLLSAFPPVPDRIAATQKNITALPARSDNVLTTPEFERIKTSLKN